MPLFFKIWFFLIGMGVSTVFAANIYFALHPEELGAFYGRVISGAIKEVSK
jgi:hypothetical protein